MLCQKRILISDTWNGFGHFILCPLNNIMLEVIKWSYIFLPNLKPVFMQRGDWSLEEPQGRLETSWGDWGSGFLATRGTIVSVRRRNIWATLFGSSPFEMHLSHWISWKSAHEYGHAIWYSFSRWHWRCLYLSSWGHFFKMWPIYECSLWGVGYLKIRHSK